MFSLQGLWYASGALARPFRSTSRLLVVLKLGVSVTLLVWLLGQTDTAALVARLRGMRLSWMIAALAIYGLMVWISAWRWRLLLAAQSVKVTISMLSESFLVATFFNNFLPSNIGGDVVRIADTAPLTTSKTVATTIVLVDRVLGLLALFAVACAGMLAAARVGVNLPGTGYLWPFFLASLVVSIAVLLFPRWLPSLLSPLRVISPEWVDERLRRLGNTLESFRQRPLDLCRAFVGALLVQMSIVAFYLCAARGLSIPLPMLYGAVLIPTSLIVQMLPISINGFGVREAVFVFFFTSVGLATDSALALSLVGAALIMVFSVSGGILLVRRELIPEAL